jgi:HD superfamily phosphohydrolase
MFEFKSEKLIKDSVHGYIRVPRVFVDKIIDTFEFQRLRNISQTGMKILYPSATHDRFSHSLGVFHIGSLAVNALLQNFKSNIHWNIRSDNTRDVFWAGNKVLFLIACLLHDIGHAPFSHALEEFYNFDLIQYSNDSNNSNESGDKAVFGVLDIITKNIIAAEGLDLGSDAYQTLYSSIRLAVSECQPHEIMSAYLVLSENAPWRSRIKDVLDILEKDDYPTIPVISSGEYDKDNQNITSKDLDNDLAFISRMILGIKYENYEPEYQVRNCFIELLNGSIDADKLDYIIRDTKSSGISNITIDIDRLINSLTIIPSTVYINKDFSIPSVDGTIIQSIETDSDSVFKIRGILDKNIRLIDPYIRETNPFTAEFPTNTYLSFIHHDNTSNYFDYIEGKFSEGEAYLDTSNVEYNNAKTVMTFAKLNPLKKITLRNCKVTEQKFEITANNGSKGELTLDSSSASEHAILKGNFIIRCNNDDNNINPVCNVKFTGHIEGKVKKLVVLKDILHEEGKLPKKSCYTSFALGYKKSAINILSNVADARNYLYLWIYADHKVVYYANFLIKELTYKAFKDYFKNDLSSFMMNNLNSNRAFRLDDNYMFVSIKSAYEIALRSSNTSDTDFLELCEEFLSRKYHKSLYKTLAEFELIFDKFLSRQSASLISQLKNLSEPPKILSDIPEQEETNYGRISAEKFDDILVKKKDKEETPIKLSDFAQDIIWIDPQASLKGLKPHNILIAFNGTKTISTMDRLQVLGNEKSSILTKNYFYIYYKLKEECSIVDADDAPEYIKEILIKYFDEKLKTNSDTKQQKT